MKKKIFYIIIITFSCLLFFYKLLSDTPNGSNTGFKRAFINPEIKFGQMFDFKHTYFDFAWRPTDKIWLYDYKDSLTLLKMDFFLKRLEKIKPETPRTFKLTLPNISLDNLNSNIYITNGLGNIAIINNNQPALYEVPRTNFDETNVISRNSIAVRSLIQINSENRLELNKIILHKNPTISKKYLLPKQVDGFFCADGLLDYDKVSASLIYMYFYRGTFLCLDTNLNIKYQAKTIDTIKTAKIRVGSYTTKLKDGRTIIKKTPITPPNLVCRRLAINNDRIYILSGIKADNETSASFFKNEPIDVYSLKDGKYMHSFYLPKYRGLQVRQFRVKDNLIIAVYRNYLVTFDFKGET